MSRSGPFFNTATKRTRTLPVDGLDDRTFNALHWTRQLELRPLRKRRRWEQWMEEDRNVRLDQDWDPNITEEQK